MGRKATSLAHLSVNERANLSNVLFNRLHFDRAMVQAALAIKVKFMGQSLFLCAKLTLNCEIDSVSDFLDAVPARKIFQMARRRAILGSR